MIPVPDGSSGRDIHRWLFYIFMHRPHGCEARPYYLVEVRSGSEVEAAAVGGSGEHRILPVSECFAHWPTLGMFNDRASREAFFLSRKTVREWTRSLNPTMLRVRRMTLAATSRTVGAAPYVALPYTHGEYFSAQEALRNVESGEWVSCAINSRVAVGLARCAGKTAVFVRGDLAGFVMGNSVCVHYPHQLPLLRKTFGESYEVR